MLTCCERIRRTLRFEPVDRLPRVEWAPWWDQTLTRWQTEGLPTHLPVGRAGMVPTQEYFGLDPLYQCRIHPLKPDFPKTPYGEGPVYDMASYEAVRPYLFPELDWDTLLPAGLRQRHARGEVGIWFTVDGFFWFPRTLFGIQRHLLAFYDAPDVMHRMNADLVEFILRVVEEITAILQPEFMTFAEDMSYNHGPMLSRKTFERFEAPYFRQVMPLIKQRGVTPIVDSDGNVESCIDWFTDTGIEGILPLERQSGVDVQAIRVRHPQLIMLGGFDKMTMPHGTVAMRAEWERLLPVMQTGGFIPSVDHQTPPGVSLAQYGEFRRLMDEYTAINWLPIQLNQYPHRPE